MDDEGGGTALVFVYKRDQLVEEKYSFNSLNDLPERIAAAIRERGGTEGEIVV